MISYFKLFYRLLVINTFTFGGGYTIVYIIKDEFVEKLKLLEDKDIDEMISISQSIPGALAISTSFLVGYKLKGYKGAFVSILAAVLPCLVIITGISYFYKEFIKNDYVKFYLNNISASVSAILLLSVLKLMKKAYSKYRNIFLFIFIISFLLKVIFNFKLVYILVCSAALNLIINHYFERKGE